MNTYQVCRQVKYLIESRKWDDNESNESVFGAGVVSVAPQAEAMDKFRYPLAMVLPGSASVDAEEMDLLEQQITVRVICMVEADGYGESPLIGAHRISTGSSDGRGILEIEPELFAAIARSSGADGIEIRLWSSSEVQAELIEDLGYVIARDYTFGCLTTTTKTYPSPFRFKVVDSASAGQADLTWTNPAIRYDSFHVVARYSAGATAPATIASGTGITLSSDFPTSVSVTGLAAGTYSFSVFVTYDEMSEPPDSDDFSSPAASYSVAIT
tara:strand:+ start:53 stop:862 length:810 start_codon:yes stop_codon:yes gene_type:complete